MAAEAIARELQLDLYKIALSQVGAQIYRRDGEKSRSLVRACGIASSPPPRFPTPQ